MATTKPRVTVTLEPHVYETFRVFADAQGRRPSAVIAEMLTEVEPSVRKTLAILLAARGAPAAVLEDLKALFESVSDEVDQAAGGALKAVDEALKGGNQPPSSNTGVTSGGSTARNHKPRTLRG